jgi:hypothetical protein
MLFNLIAAEALFAVGVFAVLMLTWPDPPWDLLQWGGVPVLVVFPVVTYPVSKLVWLAVDVQFRPLRPGDVAPDPGGPDA